MNTSQLPSLKKIDAAEFRRQLVGLSDPSRKLDAMSEKSLRLEIIDFMALLPELYSPLADDRTKLWEHIAKGIFVACQEVRSDDLQAWSSVVLREIQAENWMAATNKRWSDFHHVVTGRPPEWREAFIQQANRCLPALLPLARAVWQSRYNAHQADLAGARHRELEDLLTGAEKGGET